MAKGREFIGLHLFKFRDVEYQILRHLRWIIALVFVVVEPPAIRRSANIGLVGAHDGPKPGSGTNWRPARDALIQPGFGRKKRIVNFKQ